MFHVGLKFIFCRRWKVVYMSLCSLAPVGDYPALQYLVVCRPNNNNDDNNNNRNYNYNSNNK